MEMSDNVPLSTMPEVWKERAFSFWARIARYGSADLTPSVTQETTLTFECTDLTGHWTVAATTAGGEPADEV